MDRVATIECATGDARCNPRKRIAVTRHDYAFGPDTACAGPFFVRLTDQRVTLRFGNRHGWVFT